MATCETCRWYEKRNRYCRRLPPTNVITFNGFARFPTVAGDQWCGEHPELKDKNDG